MKITTTTIRTSLIAAGLAAVAASTALAQSHGDPKLAAQAKVKPDAARAIALGVQPGTVKDWELEKEAGGSGLRYSFDIDVHGKIHEVGIDAADGKVLENIVESAADEAREAKSEDHDGEQGDHH